jgi:hypothetical protein
VTRFEASLSPPFPVVIVFKTLRAIADPEMQDCEWRLASPKLTKGAFSVGDAP